MNSLLQCALRSTTVQLMPHSRVQESEAQQTGGTQSSREGDSEDEEADQEDQECRSPDGSGEHSSEAGSGEEEEEDAAELSGEENSQEEEEEDSESEEEGSEEALDSGSDDDGPHAPEGCTSPAEGSAALQPEPGVDAEGLQSPSPSGEDHPSPEAVRICGTAP